MGMADIPTASPPPLPPSLGGSDAVPPAPPATTGVMPGTVEKRSRWSAGKAVAAVVVVVGLFFGAFIWFAWPFAGGAVDSVQANVPADATVGTCYSKGGDRLTVPCADWHHFEVLATYRYPAEAEYPAKLERLAGTDSCDIAFEQYMGEPVDDSSWTYAMAVPTESEWARGARQAVCVLFNNAVIKTPGRANE